MTNEEMLDDLKQYIDVKTSALEENLKSEIKTYVQEIVSESTESILGALGDKAVSTDETLDNHEIRIAKLESRVA